MCSIWRRRDTARCIFKLHFAPRSFRAGEAVNEEGAEWSLAAFAAQRADRLVTRPIRRPRQQRMRARDRLIGINSSPSRQHGAAEANGERETLVTLRWIA